VTKTSISNSKSGASNPLAGTLQTVPNQPSRLKIYKIASSPYWQARVYVNGRYRISSLKTPDLKKAQAEAKRFFVRALVEAETNPTKGTRSKIEARSFPAVGKAFIESQNIKGKERRYNDDRIRFNKELVPFFSTKEMVDISSADIGELSKHLLASGKSPATTNQYLIVLRKILKYAADNKIIPNVPNFPRVAGRSTVTTRDYFTQEELKKLTDAVDELAKDKVKVRGVQITLELKHLISFMVNSFLRPTDLRVIRHQHVTVKDRPEEKSPLYQHFLLLSHPATKTTGTEVVTMPAAYRYYQRLRAAQVKRGYGKDEDYLWMPEYPNRDTMVAVLGRQFRAVVKHAQIQSKGEKHTMYSLRHSSIMFRLTLGDSVNTLSLARNARTSQAMIDKHYASRLTPMMAVDELHSFKAKPKKKATETTKASEAQDVVDVPAKKVTAKKAAPPKKTTPAKRVNPLKRSKALE
jgi:integrase